MVKKTVAKQTAAKKTVAKKTAAKKTVAKKTAAKKTVAKKTVAKKTVAKKTGAKKTAAKKTVAKKTAAKKTAARKAVAKKPRRTTKPALLAGGNPQIPKGDGDAPVQAYIAAMPGWKRDVGRRLDALIERAFPEVRKAVKWNSPLYGAQGQGWFLGIHCFTHYVKVAFFRCTSLRPMPPGASRTAHTRYLDIRQDGAFDEARFMAWVKQASRMPGDPMGSRTQ